MNRKLNLLFVIFVMAFALFFNGNAVVAQSAKAESKLKINPSSNGVKFATPVEISFDSPADYDAFAAGQLNLSFTLRNTLSGKTIVFDPRMVREGFRPSADKSRITVWLVVENPSAPLAEAACVETKAAAERMRDGSGVGITLDYAACGGGGAAQGGAAGTAQRPGEPIGGIIVKGGKNEGSQMVAGNPIGNIIVKGGKNPGGNMRVVAGSTQTGPEAGSAAMRMGPNTVVMKGAGSPKAQGW